MVALVIYRLFLSVVAGHTLLFHYFIDLSLEYTRQQRKIEKYLKQTEFSLLFLIMMAKIEAITKEITGIM